MRYLLIVADDFGIGPATSEGILRLARQGIVGGSVLLVNSPYAEEGVAAWKAAGRPMELGWHPALTIDRPLLPPERVPSLVDHDGNFYPLNTFVKRLFMRALDLQHIRAELEAQYQRCTELLGSRPQLINGHHHLHVFKPIGRILHEIISKDAPRPYLRQVREPWSMLFRVSGSRAKRLFLNWQGCRAARRQRQHGFPGNDWLIGVTDPYSAVDETFYPDLIRNAPGKIVELMCHPGLHDATIIGRDCTASDGMLERRVRELELLSAPAFLHASKDAGFELISPARLVERVSHDQAPTGS